MRQEEYITQQNMGAKRPPFRPGLTITDDHIAPNAVMMEPPRRTPIIKAEMEHATNLIAEGINEARSLVERLIPILGASNVAKERVEQPKDNSPVPPMVHAIREQIEGLRELVAIIKDAASRVEV